MEDGGDCKGDSVQRTSPVIELESRQHRGRHPSLVISRYLSPSLVISRDLRFNHSPPALLWLSGKGHFKNILRTSGLMRQSIHQSGGLKIMTTFIDVFSHFRREGSTFQLTIVQMSLFKIQEKRKKNHKQPQCRAVTICKWRKWSLLKRAHRKIHRKTHTHKKNNKKIRLHIVYKCT